MLDVLMVFYAAVIIAVVFLAVRKRGHKWMFKFMIPTYILLIPGVLFLGILDDPYMLVEYTFSCVFASLLVFFIREV